MQDYTTDNKNSTEGDCERNSGIVAFTVFGEPVAKGRPRTVRNKNRYGQTDVHTYTPQKTKEQEKRIAWVYKTIYGDFKFQKRDPLMVSIKFFMKMPKNENKKTKQKMMAGEIRPVKKVFDADNGGKLVLDALNDVAYEDDSQVVDMHFCKYYSAEPRTEIFIARLQNENE